MGIDPHNLRFLVHARDLGASFERTLAIGRQAVFVEPRAAAALARLRGLPALPDGALVGDAPGKPAYFEPLMQRWFGAREVDAVDASPYESARFVHDMNRPWSDAAPGAALPAPGQYDAVLDYGCLEHVFDFPTAWRNVVATVRIGGHVLHALPANNLAGHGFYQFSPELFCNLYQRERGFELRAMFYALPADPRHWWRVANPLEVRRRVSLANAHEAYLLVLAKKLAEPGPLPPPQQSDYAQAEWLGQGGADGVARGPSRWQAPLAQLGLLDAARRARARWQGIQRSRFALPSPDYERVEVDALLRGAR